MNISKMTRKQFLELPKNKWDLNRYDYFDRCFMVY